MGKHGDFCPPAHGIRIYFGVLAFSEPLTLLSGCGILLILSAVILLNSEGGEKTAE